MFVFEEVAENDKDMFEKVSERIYDPKNSVWCADRENDIYIVCLGKNGVETPVVFNIWFEDRLFEFLLPETDINYSVAPKLFVRLPDSLANEKIAVENTIKRLFHDVHRNLYGSLPQNVDDHVFDFDSFKFKD